MMSEKVVHLSNWEECFGFFSELTSKDEMLIAHVGKIHLALPLSQEQSLRPLIGQTIAIIRTDIPKKEYLFRILESKPIERSESPK